MIDGKVNYYHSVITPVIVQPRKEQVICLEPEFIRKQDGHNKQDCEIAAGKRWIEAHGEYYAKENVTLLGDDLYCHQPFCKLLRSKGFYFIFVCKSESHEMLYETVRFLAANGTLSSHCVRRWNGKHGEIHTYRYTNDLPLTGEPDAMLVNWCELSITHEQTGEVIYRNAFATDFMILETTVEAIVQDGRARWKVENEIIMSSKPKAIITLNTILDMGITFWHLFCFRSTCWRLFSRLFCPLWTRVTN